jgi:hypothetical protein
VLVIRAYGPLGCHGAGITPKQRFLDSIRGERVAENLLNAHVHCAFTHYPARGAVITEPASGAAGGALQ